MDPERTTSPTSLHDDVAMLRQAAARLERAGLIVDRASLSAAHRRALFALERHVAGDNAPESPRPQIGFPYPHTR